MLCTLAASIGILNKFYLCVNSHAFLVPGFAKYKATLLSLQQKNLVRMSRKQGKPPAIVAEAAAPPAEPPVLSNREELLKKCRAARQNARSKGLPPPRKNKKSETTPAGGAGAAAAAYADATPISDEERKEQQMAALRKELLETCDGDIEEFLKRQDIDARLLPAIRNSISKLEKGASVESTIMDTMKALHLAASL